jgi:GcrA cell cycle regulator
MPVSIRECHTAEEGLGLRPLLQGAPPHGEQRPSSRKSGPPHDWNDAIIARVREHYTAGLYHSKIAAQVNDEFGTSFSRNAIIGKCRRENLPARRHDRVGRPRRYGYPQSDRITPPQGRSAKRRMPVPEMPSPDHLGLSILDINEMICKFPHGEGASITFCGHQTKADSPYCQFHHRLSYRPAA